MAAKRKVTVHKKRRVFDGFFKIDEAEVTRSKIVGKGEIKSKWLVFERGDSAAALMHDTKRDVIILTEQFRYPTYEKGPGWLIETMAGSMEKGEKPEACIKREILEELGYKAGKLDFIGRFYVSPGGTSERIFLYYAPVTPEDCVNPKASGVASEHEDIRRLEVPRADFIEGVLNGKYEDAKLLIAGLWLARQPHKKLAPARRKPRKAG